MTYSKYLSLQLFAFPYFSLAFAPKGKPYAATLTDNCPSTVTEGDDVNCTCATTDVGSPEGTLRWVGSDTDHMSLFNVTRADNVKAFTCELMWNGELMNSLTYILNVFCKLHKLEANGFSDMAKVGPVPVQSLIVNKKNTNNKNSSSYNYTPSKHGTSKHTITSGHASKLLTNKHNSSHWRKTHHLSSKQTCKQTI